MSQCTHIQIKCEKCSKENTYKNYTSIHLSVNPELKEKIMNDDIFKYTCTHCGYTTYYRHPLFYHDRDNKIMLAFAKDSEELEANLTALKSEGMNIDGYRIRWTNNWFSFKEKIQIFDHHRDDRVIEIYKDLLLNEFNKNYKDAGRTIAFYDHTDEECIMVVSEKYDPKFYHFSSDIYNEKLNDPLISKIIKYDTSIDVNETYINRILNLDINVVLAEVKTKEFVQVFALNYFDKAKTHNHVLVDYKGKEYEGEIIQLFVKDARDVPPHIRFINRVLKIREMDDEEISLNLERIASLLYKDSDQPLLNELLNTLSEVKVFLPLCKDEHGELHREIIHTVDDRIVMPIFTQEKEAKFYAHEDMCYEVSFVDLIHEFKDMSFVLNPQSKELLIIDSKISELVLDFIERKQIYLN